MAAPPSFLKRVAITVTAGAWILCLAPRAARAFSMYCDLGAGPSYLLSGKNYFTDASAPAPMNIGPAINLGLNFSFLDDRSPIDFHLGFDGRVESGTNALGRYYNVFSPIVKLKIQFWRIFLAGGVSYWTFQRNNGSAFWYDGFQPSTPALGYLGEVGFLFPISPNASFGISASGQWLSNGGTISPLPVALDVLGFFRFYFWYPLSSKSASGVTSGSGGSANSSREWKGWRYPYGSQK